MISRAFFFFFFPGGTGVWTQGLALSRQVSAFFALVILVVYALIGLDLSPPIYSSPVAGMTGTHHCTQPLIEMGGGLMNFSLGLVSHHDAPSLSAE
jgi:hypothetical protein